jgi:MFS family permease
MLPSGGQVPRASEPPGSRWLYALRALRHRDFRFFGLGRLVSLSGLWMQTIALSWLAYQLTDSPLMLGLINFVALLPAGLVSLVGGVVSDWFPRRTLILVTQIVLAFQALTLAVIAWIGLIQVWHIVVAVFVVGVSDAIEQPARFVFLMEIVGEEDFTSAVGLNSVVASVARSIGPIVAGALISWIGAAGSFLANFVIYLLVIGIFLLMRLPAGGDAGRSLCSGAGRSLHLGRDLLAGLVYIWRNRTIRVILLLVAVPTFLAQPYVALLPVFARDVLRTDASGYGVLMGAAGLGAACGALIAAGIELKCSKRWLLGASLAFPAFLALFACSCRIAPSIGLLCLVGASQLVQQVLTSSLLQFAAANEFRGRVASFFSLFNNGLTRLGGIQAGAIAQYWGAPAAVLSGTLSSLLWVLAVIWRSGIRRLL